MKQALDMFLQTENGWAVCRVIAPNALKDTQPVVQRMTEHMDLGLVPIYKLSIHPNLLCGLHGALLPPGPTCLCPRGDLGSVWCTTLAERHAGRKGFSCPSSSLFPLILTSSA